VKTVQDCIKKLAIVANREPQYQNLPPGLPPVTIGNFMFEGDLVHDTPPVFLTSELTIDII